MNFGVKVWGGYMWPTAGSSGLGNEPSKYKKERNFLLLK
jgi:hypothetical protein